MIRILLLPLAAAAALAAAAPASACSPLPGYRVPTSLELAERAEAIVIATVEAQVGEGPSPFDTEIVVRPVLLLKGEAMPGQIRFEGMLATRRDRATRSDPRELFQPNPDALTGGCRRYVFKKGMQLVLFLERHDGVLRPADYPFSRAMEDVPSAEALWVRAVRLYAEIAALPPEARRAALIARQEALSAAGDADSLLLARDIGRQLERKRNPPFD